MCGVANQADFLVTKVDSNGNVQWQNTYGDLQYADILNTAIELPNGGFVLVGWTQFPELSPGDIGEYKSDCRLIWIDANGNVTKDKFYGGDWPDRPNAVLLSADQQHLIVGAVSKSNISGDKSENTFNMSYTDNWYHDFWVLKIRISDGVKIWDRTYGGTRQDYLTSMTSAPDGSYILAGYSESPNSTQCSPCIGNKQAAELSNMDYWMVKIDQNGVKQWDKVFGGGYYDQCYDVKSTADGYVLTGYSNSQPLAGYKTKSVIGSADYYVVKTNFFGAQQWDQVLGTTSTERSQSIAAVNNGGIIVGGKPDALSDYPITFLNHNGTVEWSKTLRISDQPFNPSTDNGFGNLLLTSDKRLVVAGNTTKEAPYMDKSVWSRPEGDFWLYVTQPIIYKELSALNSMTLYQAFSQTMAVDGNSSDYYFHIVKGDLPVCLQMTVNGYIGGTPCGQGTFNFTVLARHKTTGKEYTRNYNVYIGGVGPGQQREENFIAVYPNPANQEVHITLPDVSNRLVDIILIDAMGTTQSLYKHAENREGEIVINTSAIQEGLYSLVIRYDQSTSQQHLIIRR